MRRPGRAAPVGRGRGPCRGPGCRRTHRHPAPATHDRSWPPAAVRDRARPSRAAPGRGSTPGRRSRTGDRRSGRRSRRGDGVEVNVSSTYGSTPVGRLVPPRARSPDRRARPCAGCPRRQIAVEEGDRGAPTDRRVRARRRVAEGDDTSRDRPAVAVESRTAVFDLRHHVDAGHSARHRSSGRPADSCRRRAPTRRRRGLGSAPVLGAADQDDRPGAVVGDR